MMKSAFDKIMNKQIYLCDKQNLIAKTLATEIISNDNCGTYSICLFHHLMEMSALSPFN